VVGPSAFTVTLTGPRAAVQEATATEHAGGGSTVVGALPSSNRAAGDGVTTGGAAFLAVAVESRLVSVAGSGALGTDWTSWDGLTAPGVEVAAVALEAFFELGFGLMAPPRTRSTMPRTATSAADLRFWILAHPSRPRISPNTPNRSTTNPRRANAAPTKSPIHELAQSRICDVDQTVLSLRGRQCVRLDTPCHRWALRGAERAVLRLVPTLFTWSL
jgi:hypothetical protein